MDGGSSLNIMYVETLDGLGIACSTLRPSSALFHDIIPGHQAYPLQRISLPVPFGDPFNFCTKQLHYEVVEFLGSYNAILERSCVGEEILRPGGGTHPP
jgi:hypothetical protein